MRPPAPLLLGRCGRSPCCSAGTARGHWSPYPADERNLRHHPRLGRYEHDHTRRWSAKIAAADAFGFVTPEYNHGLTAPLKNAIDYLHNEWAYKPVGFVSYGGGAAGTRAMQMLKPVVGALRMVPVTDAVNIPFVTQFLGDDGELTANEVMDGAATTVLDELARVAAASSRCAHTGPNQEHHGGLAVGRRAQPRDHRLLPVHRGGHRRGAAPLLHAAAGIALAVRRRQRAPLPAAGGQPPAHHGDGGRPGPALPAGGGAARPGLRRLPDGGAAGLRGAARAPFTELEPHYRQALAGVPTEWDAQMPRSGRVYHTEAHPMRDEAGAITGALLVSEDVTAQRRAAGRLRAAQEFNEAVVKASPDVATICDLRSGEVLWSSRDLWEMIGWSSEEAAAHGTPSMQAWIPDEDRAKVAAANAVVSVLPDGEHSTVRFRRPAPDGSWRWLSRRTVPFARDAEGVAHQGLSVVRDVTDVVLAEETLRHAAHHDALTGLPHRAALEERLATALAVARRDQTRVAVLRHADTALYGAKRSGKDQVVSFLSP